MNDMMRNVHEYDGKLVKTDIPVIEKNEEERLLARFMQRRMQHAAIFISRSILSSDHAQQNNDTINGLDARRLFVYVLHLIDKLPEEDHGEWDHLLEEQLADMTNLGPCPQGRTIRLWQLVSSLSDVNTKDTTLSNK